MFLNKHNDSIISFSIDNDVFTFADARLSRHATRWPPLAPSTPRLWSSRRRATPSPTLRRRSWRIPFALGFPRRSGTHLNVTSPHSFVLRGHSRRLKMNGILSVSFSLSYLYGQEFCKMSVLLSPKQKKSTTTLLLKKQFKKKRSRRDKHFYSFCLVRLWSSVTGPPLQWWLCQGAKVLIHILKGGHAMHENVRRRRRQQRLSQNRRKLRQPLLSVISVVVSSWGQPFNLIFADEDGRRDHDGDKWPMTHAIIRQIVLLLLLFLVKSVWPGCGGRSAMLGSSTRLTTNWP